MLTLTGALLDPLMRDNPRAADHLHTTTPPASGSNCQRHFGELGGQDGEPAARRAGRGSGDPVGVLLPAHWQTAAVLLGIWWIGAEAVLDSLTT